MSLRWRVASLLAAIALAVGAFTAVAFLVTTSSQLRAGIDDSMRARATAVNEGQGVDNGHGRGGQDHGDGDPTSACPDAASFQPASAAQIVGTDGTATSCIQGGPPLPFTAAERDLASGSTQITTVTIDGQGYRLLSTPWHDGGLLQIARSTAESNGVLDRLRIQVVLFVAAATAVSAAIGWYLATRLSRPLVRLRDAAHRMATTLDLREQIDVSGPGEVGSLAASFATMVRAVARSQEQQRRLVADASHEMRTPMTSLRSNVELLGRIERLRPAERQEVVAEVLEDVDELSALMGELVDLASDLQTTEPVEEVRLGDLARAVAARFERRTGRSVVVDEVGGDAAARLTGRPRQLERAISNLVDNALKYGDPRAPVAVIVDSTSVTVRDHGPGIGAEDIDHVFDRFYRATSVRSDPGSGLGLSIVDAIVRAHGGEVFARNATDGDGAEVGFSLPA